MMTPVTSIKKKLRNTVFYILQTTRTSYNLRFGSRRTEMEFNEEKPSVCTVCGEAFTNKDAFNVHKETEHRDELIKTEGEYLKMHRSEGIVFGNSAKQTTQSCSEDR